MTKYTHYVALFLHADTFAKLSRLAATEFKYITCVPHEPQLAVFAVKKPVGFSEEDFLVELKKLKEVPQAQVV